MVNSSSYACAALCGCVIADYRGAWLTHRVAHAKRCAAVHCRLSRCMVTSSSCACEALCGSVIADYRGAWLTLRVVHAKRCAAVHRRLSRCMVNSSGAHPSVVPQPRWGWPIDGACIPGALPRAMFRCPIGACEDAMPVYPDIQAVIVAWQRHRRLPCRMVHSLSCAYEVRRGRVIAVYRVVWFTRWVAHAGRCVVVASPFTATHGLRGSLPCGWRVSLLESGLAGRRRRHPSVAFTQHVYNSAVGAYRSSVGPLLVGNCISGLRRRSGCRVRSTSPDERCCISGYTGCDCCSAATSPFTATHG